MHFRQTNVVCDEDKMATLVNAVKRRRDKIAKPPKKFDQVRIGQISEATGMRYLWPMEEQKASLVNPNHYIVTASRRTYLDNSQAHSKENPEKNPSF